VERYLRSVYDRRRALAKDLEDAVAVKNDRRVLVNADAEVVRIVGYGRDQPADAAALGKVLIDDYVFKEAEAGREFDRAFVGMRRRFAADDHRGAHASSTGACSGEHHIAIADHVTQLIGKSRPAEQAHKPHLIAACYKNTGDAVE